MIICIMLGSSSSGWNEIIGSENGPVERMSAAIWLMGFSWCLVAAYAQRTRAVEWLSVAIFLLLFGLRELDAHLWATGWNLDKLVNYWNPQFPLGERLLVLGFLVLPCTVVGAILCCRLWQSIGPAWRTGESWLSHLLVGLALLVFCMTIDKIGSYTLPFLGASDWRQIILMIIEEFFEIVLPVFSLASLWPYLQNALLCSD